MIFNIDYYLFYLDIFVQHNINCLYLRIMILSFNYILFVNTVFADG